MEPLQAAGGDGTTCRQPGRTYVVDVFESVGLAESLDGLEEDGPIAERVDVDEAVATFEDGVCKITLPKVAAERYQTIEVGAA